MIPIITPANELEERRTYRQLIHLVAPPTAHLHNVRDIHTEGMIPLKPGVAEGAAHIVGVVDLPAIVGDDLLPRHDRVRQNDLLCRWGGGWRRVEKEGYV